MESAATSNIDRVRDALAAGEEIPAEHPDYPYMPVYVNRLRLSGFPVDLVRREGAPAVYRTRRPITVGSRVQVVHGYGVMLPEWVRRHVGGMVIEDESDAVYVRFRVGRREGDYWLNLREVCNADL